MLFGHSLRIPVQMNIHGDQMLMMLIAHLRPKSYYYCRGMDTQPSSPSVQDGWNFSYKVLSSE